MKTRVATPIMKFIGPLLIILASASAAFAFDSLSFKVTRGDPDLRDDLRAISLVPTTIREQRTDAREIFGAALADYANLVNALYAHGYYSGVVHITLDGREASAIPLLAIPSRISKVAVSIDPGPQFRFGRVSIAPLAPGTNLPDTFQRGQPAPSVVVQDAVDVAITAWRDASRAKAAVKSQQIVADHAARTLSADIALAPGPRVAFGQLVQTTDSAVRSGRIRRIAGLPTGQAFAPAELDRVTERLRRTGAFSSVSIREAETLGPDDSMDILLSLTDAKPRRFGFGGQVSSLEGAELSGFWMHRNLLGGAERLRIDGIISNIGGQTDGIDYSLGARLDFHASLGTDTMAFLKAKLARLNEPAFRADTLDLGLGVKKWYSSSLTGEVGIDYQLSKTEDEFGTREFSMLTFPVDFNLDRRKNPLNASGGYYLDLQAMPFVGLDGSASGVRAYGDARTYYGVGTDDRVVLAGRLQYGAIFGPEIAEARPDMLFFSGGGGTVRGQPYQSLDVDLGGGIQTGGRSFLGMSAEVRAKITDSFGAVAFYDAGYIGAETLYDGTGNWQSGAGLGLRYETGLGPIRLDVAVPTGGTTGQGVQFYIGIGQAF